MWNSLVHLLQLLKYATSKLLEIDGLRIYGQSQHKTAVISFNISSIHPYDLGTILDKLGVAVRTGHHCAQPIMDFFKIRNFFVIFKSSKNSRD